MIRLLVTNIHNQSSWLYCIEVEVQTLWQKKVFQVVLNSLRKKLSFAALSDSCFTIFKKQSTGRTDHLFIMIAPKMKLDKDLLDNMT